MARASSLAGLWYEADPTRLADAIDAWLGEADRPVDARVRALVLPHAGYRWSGRVAAQAVAAVRGRTFQRIVVLGPSHHRLLEDRIALPPVDDLTTPLGRIPLDLDALETLEGDETFVRIPGVHEPEHSVEIELPLLQRACGAFRLVPLVVGDLGREAATRAAEALLRVTTPDTLVVASSDFVHYGPRFGYVPFEREVPTRIERLDRGAFERIRALDVEGFVDYVERTGATICGRRPLEVLLRMLPRDAEVALEGYDTSGHLTGDWENSVSYVGAICRLDAWPAPSVEDRDVGPLEGDMRARVRTLARDAIRFRLRQGRRPDAQDLGLDADPRWSIPAGVFVTLRSPDGSLRGCVGRIRARLPLWQAVAGAAIGAATEDGRFAPVDPEEVEDLRIKVSVLGPLRRIEDPREIVLGRDGIVLTYGPWSATFLPEVAVEQGWDLETTLSMLAQKAGLDPDVWRRGATLQTFTSDAF